MITSFDDIRPYNNSEIPAAVHRLFDSEEAAAKMRGLFPWADVEKLKTEIDDIGTSDQFQHIVMTQLIASVIRGSTLGFTYSGLENVQGKMPCLFVSNHRDIVLDAMLLQYVFLVEDLNTCHIAFGDNLMFDGFFKDFWKVNKMFQMSRGGHLKSFYASLMHVSEYIRYLITERGENVWIAQHNGRAKNGIDVTDSALIKMFGMSRRDDKVASLAELNIVPVTVSYEWEPCDKLKAVEVCISLHQKYEKQPGEDLNSVLTGMTQPKGRVHFHMSPAITKEELNALDKGSCASFHRRVAELIDERIYSAYRLYPNNYIAHDLLCGTEEFANHYTAEEKARFLHYMNWMEAYPQLDREELERIFLGIYANPIDHYNKVKSR